MTNDGAGRLRRIARLLAPLVLTAAPAGAQPGTAITAPGPQGPLAGTLLGEGQGRPVVLIVPGSGPTDRDGNNPMGVAGGPYRRLAEALAARGVATVRIDKRGMFGSKAAIADPNAVTIAGYAADVHAWARAIRARTGAPCVWVLGHSEGGLVALAAARQPADLCGLILVAAPGRPLGQVVRAQFRDNPANAPLYGQADAALTALETGRPLDRAALHPALAQLFAPPVEGYWRDILAYDPARLIAAYRGPVLIEQGDRDLQVPLADAQALAAAQPRARLVVVPGANHVLRAAGTERAANLAIYADTAAPLADGFVAPIVALTRGG